MVCHVELKFIASINKMKSGLNFAIDESLIYLLMRKTQRSQNA